MDLTNDSAEVAAAVVQNLIEEIELGDEEQGQETEAGPLPGAQLQVQPLQMTQTQSTGPSSRDRTRNADRDILQQLPFMNNFDPSKRRDQKRRRRYNIDGLGRPQLLPSDLEGCDCLEVDCPGCHFPCKNCGDTKCGHECRVGRKWVYESIEVEGRHCTTRTHPIVKTQGFSSRLDV